ncbi:ABC transporter permease [Nesterenkonia ebinurensis]|uniref:ABC transporter permease n=1 Tax=Nesterenkonia ebinurensis TaxID=2608252 RepID=UPI00123CDC41|nr:ABC transporter permease [Nesterenkonia ebinurensis]
MNKRVLKSRPLVLGGFIVISVVMVAVFAPLIAPMDPNSQSLENRLSGWGTPGYILGTDQYGRDLLSRLIHGARISLLAGVIAVAVGAVAGLVLGLLSGYFGGWVDLVIGRIFDVLLAFPTILLALAIVAALGPSMTNLIIAIGVATTPHFGRVIRGAILAVRSRDYIVAAEAFGASDFYTMWRHVLPNVLPPVIVTTSLGIGSAIQTEATLSFLGLGVSPPTPTWGNIINDGQAYLGIAPGISLFAGAAIVVAVVGFSLFGDGLRDLLDPRVRK